MAEEKQQEPVKERIGKWPSALATLAMRLRTRLLHTCLVVMGTTALLVILPLYIGARTDWSQLVGDWQPKEAVFLPEVRFVAEFPAKPETIASVLRGESSAPTFGVRVFREGMSRLPIAEHLSFKDQVIEGLTRRQIIRRNKDGRLVLTAMPSEDVGSKTFVFYVDLTPAQLRAMMTLKHPHLYFNGMWGPFEIYANGKKISEGAARNGLLSRGQILDFKTPGLRLTFVVKNIYKDRILGLHYLNGLSILSEHELSQLALTDGIKEHIEKIVLTAVFGVIAITIGLFAVVTGYFDILVFPVVALLFGTTVWMESPAYFLSRNGASLTAEKVAIYLLLVFFLHIQSLAFFRLREKKYSLHALWTKRDLIKRIVVGKDPFASNVSVMFVVLGLLFIVYFSLVLIWNLPPYIALGHVSFGISVSLFVSQADAFKTGFRALKCSRLEAKNRGDERLFDALNKRLRLAGGYAASMAVLCLVYGIGLPLRSEGVGADHWLLVSLVPICVQVGIFFAGVFQASRIAERFRHQIKMLHYYVEKYGNSVWKKKFCGVLIVSDLAGMGALCDFCVRHDLGLELVLKVTERVRSDLLKLFVEGFVLFNDKTNGDQDILLLNALSQQQAENVFKEAIKRWYENGGSLLESWRQLVVGLAPQDYKSELENLAAGLELHIYMGTYDDMIPRMFEDGRLDSTSAKWISLAKLEKSSLHNKVGIALSDLELVISVVGKDNFHLLKVDEILGFIEWQSSRPSERQFTIPNGGKLTA